MMKTGIEKSHKEVRRTPTSDHHNKRLTACGPVDNRSVAALQLKLIQVIDSSPALTLQRQQLEHSFGDAIQRVSEEEILLQGAFSADESPMQRQEEAVQTDNRTGMPDQLKAGVESLSGMDMSDVRVHYNSSKPAQLNALAYAKGKEIHLGSGQEKHLPHEAWHTVQQRQGRVKPTMQMAGEQMNDDVALEKEADVMGGRALQAKVGVGRVLPKGSDPLMDLVQRAPLDGGKLNLVGENHEKTTKRRRAEEGYGTDEGGGNYWTEKAFTHGSADEKRGDPDNLIIGYRIDRLKRHIVDLETNYRINDVNGMTNYCDRISRNLNSADKFSHQGEQAPMLAALVKLRSWAQGLRDSWDTDHSDINAWQSLVNKKMLFIKPEYEQLNKKYEAITGRDSKRDAIDSRYARSNAMWIAAATSGKTGLWMVGQNHIRDIDQLHGEYQTEGTYTDLRTKFTQNVKMQSRTNFETEFQAWWTDNEAHYQR